MKDMVYIDGKGDSELVDKITFLTKPQKAYGEWMKKLGPTDTPPRGRCAKFFSKHAISKKFVGRSGDFLALNQLTQS